MQCGKQKRKKHSGQILCSECNIKYNKKKPEEAVEHIPLGHRGVEKGLELRQAWLIKGILYHSEIRQKITEKGKKKQNKRDHILLNHIAKAPMEQLYFETSTSSLADTMKIR